MKASQRDDLIKLIDNTAGPVPSIISNALSIMGEILGRMPASADKGKLEYVFTTIRDANLRLGTSPGEEKTNPGVILSLRQKVLALSVDPEEPAPGPTPTPGPVTTFPPPPEAPKAGAVGGRWAVTATEAPQHFLFDGPASRVSIAVADGKQVWLGYSATPDQFIEGQASASSGTAAVFTVPAGRWYLNYKLSPGMGGSANGDISAY